MRSTRTRTRTLAALAFLTATGLFLTGCGPDSVADGSGSGSSPAASAGADEEGSSDAGSGGASGSPSAGTDSGSGTDSDADSGSGSGEDTNDAAGSGTENGPVDNPDAPGADGTFYGVLTFQAPGKLLVAERPFWVAVDTEIIGGDICGDPETPEAEKCTPDELDAVAKDGNLTVEVIIKKGVAESVRQSS
ncbi:hypothetical protein KQY30_05725 [Streptomyces sp. GMY02]|uniref:hypothetical protein n=1 Tax=Streptomyces sp. GMY02 TaxID=1333528 RepID=UPI001C2BCDE5|nr:hypothetical protein [Streptomyces sp. GMY02]QXE33867.1 hypothetical protein KQY30_05725 [Streptomyces sp. GMY02]